VCGTGQLHSGKTTIVGDCIDPETLYEGGISYSYSKDSTSVIVSRSFGKDKPTDYTISKSGVTTDNHVSVVSEKKKKISGYLGSSHATNFLPTIDDITFDSSRVNLNKYLNKSPDEVGDVEVTYLSQKLSNGAYRFIAIDVHPK
jgi:hypothetical protein